MKRSVKILAVTLAAGMVVGLAACSDSDSHITLDSYWYKDNYEGIQNSTIDGAPETLTYKVTFEGEGNGSYRVEYDEGTYTTTLTAKEFDWSYSELTYADYRSDETETVYVLTTELNISGRYIYGSSETYSDEDVVEFKNYAITTTYFRSARNTLSPLYSKQTVRSTSPNGLTAASASTMCVTKQYEYEVFYNQSASEATFTYTEYDAETGAELTDEGFTKTVTGLGGNYTLLDNNSLYMAVRGMSLSSSFSAVVDLFIPAQGGAFGVRISGGDGGTIGADDEDYGSAYKALVKAYGEPAAEEGEEPSIAYNSVSITANSDLSGTAQTAWFAAFDDEDNNQYRATMVYLEVPLPYGLGSLKYTLTSVDSVLGANVNETTASE